MGGGKRVRPVTWDDADAIRRIYRPYVERSAVTFEERLPRTDRMRERIDRIAGTYPWYVYEKDGDVTGYAYACRHRDRAAYRWAVEVSAYVDERFHRAGIGRVLYETLLGELRARGFYRAYAVITLPNAPSVAFHEGFGFVKTGTFPRAGYKLGAWHDTAWFALDLNTPQDGREPEPPRRGA